MFASGTYIILPFIAEDGEALGIGPVPEPYPPPDLPVRIIGPQLTRWAIEANDDDTFTVSTVEKSEFGNYKWVAKNDDLFVSIVLPPDSFKFESAGEDGVWVIGLPDRDTVLTADFFTYPQLTFKPADGSDAQRFKTVSIDETKQ